MTEINQNLLTALKRARTLATLVTVGQVIDDGDAAISAAGLNPYCLNDGLAERSDFLSMWWIDAAIAEAEGRS